MIDMTKSGKANKSKIMSLSYNPEEEVGKLIQQPEITSAYIRELVWVAKGGEYLRKNNASSEEIEKHLFKALRFYAGKIAEIQVLIEIEKRDISMPLEKNTQIKIHKDQKSEKIRLAETFKL